METRTLRSLVYFAAGVGFIVSIFAAAEFVDAQLRAICSINSFFSCSTVDKSAYTNTLGVPDYLVGILGFVAIFVVAAYAEKHPTDRRAALALLGVTTIGVVVAVYLLLVELVLIDALCLVCASAYLMGVVAWGGAIQIVRQGPDAAEDDDEDAEGMEGD
jgi:uncharacterized membrane protein